MIRVVGTGHIFERSVRDVTAAIEEGLPGIVAVELDVARFRALEESGWDLSARAEDRSFRAIFNAALRGGSFPVLFEGLLAKLQWELGEKFGIRAGSDMVAAVQAAKKAGAKIALIDRDIRITLNHVLSIPFKEKMKMFSRNQKDAELIGGLVGGGLENLLEEERLGPLMEGLKGEMPTLYAALVDERDRYMAIALSALQQRHPEENIVAVVGAGHKKGLEGYLKAPGGISLEGLSDIRKVSRLQLIPVSSAVLFLYIWLKIKFRFRK